MEVLDLVALSHPLFRYGVPHARQRYIPIPTDAHFILFDAIRVGPVYTMHRIMPGSDTKLVDRKDDFVSEFTLPDRLQTRESDYARWNQQHPDDPMDKGHQTGSQVRRADRLVQHDVDSLAGCCPETPSLNRQIKNRLECAIVDRASQFIDVRCVQGPMWFADAPRGKLESGQWIPDALWMSTLWRPNMTQVMSESWIMDNDQDVTKVALREVSLDYLADFTGLVLWDRIENSQFVRSRDRMHHAEWWR